MKTEMIECKSRKTAWNKCPWAARLTKVDGGFMAFESVDDFRIWKNQR